MSRRFYFLSFAVAIILVTISARLTAAAPAEDANLQRELNLQVETRGKEADEFGTKIPKAFDIMQLIYVQSAQETISASAEQIWNGIPVLLRKFQETKETTETIKGILELCWEKRSLLVSPDFEHLWELYQAQVEQEKWDPKAHERAHRCLFLLSEEEYPHFVPRSFAFLIQRELNPFIFRLQMLASLNAGQQDILKHANSEIPTPQKLVDYLVGGGAKMFFFINVTPEGSEDIPTTEDHKTIVQLMMKRDLMVVTVGLHTPEEVMQWLKEKKEESHRWEKEIVVFANIKTVAIMAHVDGYLTIIGRDPKGFSLATMENLPLAIKPQIPLPKKGEHLGLPQENAIPEHRHERQDEYPNVPPRPRRQDEYPNVPPRGQDEYIGVTPRRRPPPPPPKDDPPPSPPPKDDPPTLVPTKPDAAKAAIGKSAIVKSDTVKKAKPENGLTKNVKPLVAEKTAAIKAAAMKNARPAMAQTMKKMTLMKSSSSDAVLQGTGAKGVASPNIPKPSTSVAAQPEKGQTKKVTVPTTKVIKQRPPVSAKPQKGKPPPVNQEALQKTSPQATDDEDLKLNDAGKELDDVMAETENKVIMRDHKTKRRIIYPHEWEGKDFTKEDVPSGKESEEFDGSQNQSNVAVEKVNYQKVNHAAIKRSRRWQQKVSKSTD